MVITDTTSEPKKNSVASDTPAIEEIIYGMRMHEPMKQTKPVFFKKVSDLSFSNTSPSITCTSHLPPAVPGDSSICGLRIYQGHSATNHRGSAAERRQYRMASKRSLESICKYIKRRIAAGGGPGVSRIRYSIP